MKKIDYFHKATHAVIEAVKWPFVQKAIRRAFEARIDAGGQVADDSDRQLFDLRKEMATCHNQAEAEAVINKIVRAITAVDEAKRINEIVKAERDFMFDTDANEAEIAALDAKKKDAE